MTAPAHCSAGPVIASAKARLSSSMSGRRELTELEQHALRATLPVLAPRDRALLVAQWLTGARISEVLQLRVCDVLRGMEIVSHIGFAPATQKGRRGPTRWCPVSAELRSALESHLADLRARGALVSAKQPLFFSREVAVGGGRRAIDRETARLIIARALTRAGIRNDGRLGSHTLRKTWARSCYEASGRCLLVVQAALGHRQLDTTVRYLEPDAAVVQQAMAAAANAVSPDHSSPANRHAAA